MIFLQIKDSDIHTSHIKELERAIKEMKVNMENIEKVWQRAFLLEKLHCSKMCLAVGIVIRK